MKNYKKVNVNNCEYHEKLPDVSSWICSSVSDSTTANAQKYTNKNNQSFQHRLNTMNRVCPTFFFFGLLHLWCWFFRFCHKTHSGRFTTACFYTKSPQSNTLIQLLWLDSSGQRGSFWLHALTTGLLRCVQRFKTMETFNTATTMDLKRKPHNHQSSK